METINFAIFILPKEIKYLLMVQNAPSVISLLICLGIEVLFCFVFFIYWIRHHKEKEQLILSLWFLVTSLYHFFRLGQFFTHQTDYALFYSKASGISHFILIYLGWWFIHLYMKIKISFKQILFWSLLTGLFLVLIVFTEVYITNEIIVRQTIFGESFYSLKSGKWYMILGWLRPMMLFYLCYKLIKSRTNEFSEKVYIIAGFTAAALFSVNDMAAVFLNLKWIRMYDYAYLPLGIMFLFILTDRYFHMYNNLEALVDKRTRELSEINKSLKKEIQVRTKTENELEIYKKNLEKLVEERTLELNKVVKEYQAVNEELSSTNEILEDQRTKLQSALNKLEIATEQIVQSEKMAAIGVLTAGIAHEINNPLNFVVAGISNLENSFKELREGWDKCNEWQRYIKENKGYDYTSDMKDIEDLVVYIKTGAERIAEIIKSLSIFARYDETKQEETDIHEALDAALIILRYQLKGRIKVIKNFGKIPHIVCSSGKLNQVFINILSNAIHAIKNKGEISIKTFLDSVSNRVCITIRDTGSGIDPDIQHKIFEPFFTTKDVGVGTGLGLSIVYSIIEQMKGDIRFHTEPGNGTEFIITLPFI